MKIDPYGNVNDNCTIFTDVQETSVQPTTVDVDEITIVFEMNSFALDKSTMSVQNTESSVYTQCGLH